MNALTPKHEEQKPHEPTIDEMRVEASLLKKGVDNIDVQIATLQKTRAVEMKKLRSVMGKIETLAIEQMTI